MRLAGAASVLALANVSTVLAAALVQPRQQQQTEMAITIQLQVSKVTQESAIDVWDGENNILAQSCSSSLQSGLFEHDPITFQVDAEYGAGNFTLGSKSFVMSDDPDLNQEASCGRVVSDQELVITCHVPFFAPEAVTTSSPAKRGLGDCFPKAGGSLDLLTVAQGFENGVQNEQPLQVSFTPQQLAPPADNTTLDKRQAGQCSIWTAVTHRVGNGSPHQNPWNVQLTDPMQCPGHIGCEVAHGTSYEVGWSANIGAVYQWISAGFAVTMAVQTGSTHACPGAPGDYLALWRKVGTTAYTVRNGNFNSCTGTSYVGNSYIIWSPNQNNRGSYYYCVYGKNYVRWKGDRWLDKSPNQPGGP